MTTETVAGCRTNGLSINNEIVDVTTKDDDGWRRLLDGVAFKNMSLTAAGLFQSAAGKQAVINRILTGSVDQYQVVFGFGDRFEGAFQMSSLSDDGPHDNAEEFNFTLESSGGVAYTAGA